MDVSDSEGSKVDETFFFHKLLVSAHWRDHLLVSYREWTQNVIINIHYSLQIHWLSEKDPKWHQCLQKVKTCLCLMQLKIEIVCQVQLFYESDEHRKLRGKFPTHCTAHETISFFSFNNQPVIHLREGATGSPAVGPCWQPTATSPAKFV